VTHFVALAEQAEEQWHGLDQDAWIGRFRQEHDNLIAALRCCAEGPADAQSGLRLMAASGFYWLWNGIELGHRLASAVLERDRAPRATPARVGTLRAIAKLSLFRGRYQESLEQSQQALAAARDCGAPQPLMLALDMLGSALTTAGRLDEALPMQQEALELARRHGETRLITAMLNSIAECRRSAGQWDAAERDYREALALARTQGGRLTVVVVLNNLIRVQVARGRIDEARRFAVECLALVRDDKVGVDLLEATVGLASCQGDHAAAMASSSSVTKRSLTRTPPMSRSIWRTGGTVPARSRTNAPTPTSPLPPLPAPPPHTTTLSILMFEIAVAAVSARWSRCSSMSSWYA
jgi:tetratricopeptide (TPR) repeat protein